MYTRFLLLVNRHAIQFFFYTLASQYLTVNTPDVKYDGAGEDVIALS